MAWGDSERLAERLAAVLAVILGGLAVAVSFPAVGEALFRGYFVQDADEMIRAWYGRCAWKNPAIVPYSHLSMPGWTAVLALGEGLGRLLGLPLTLPGRLVTVAAAWCVLRDGARWIRAVGGTAGEAAAAVLLIAACPGFFLLSLSVYPSVAFAALAVRASRQWSEGHLRSAVFTISWAPLVRWEGVLLLALFGAGLVVRRAPRLLGLLLGPYGVTLIVNAAAYGNPWKPLAYRTTRAMGAWLVYNPSLTWDAILPALKSLCTLYPPLMLVGAVLAAPFLAVRWRVHRLGLLPWAAAGLAFALLSIQHDTMVWPLRVMATPTALGTLTLLALGFRSRLRRAVPWVLATAVAVSVVLSHQRIQGQSIPAPGRFRWEVGFHMFVRWADATEVRDWLLANGADQDFVIVNHLNANLLRADGDCRLWDLPLRLGSVGMSLDRGFQPSFGLPPGRGLVVFHAGAAADPRCAAAAWFPVPGISVYACEPTARPQGPTEGR